jgi:hypothetical protein
MSIRVPMSTFSDSGFNIDRVSVTVSGNSYSEEQNLTISEDSATGLFKFLEAGTYEVSVNAYEGDYHVAEGSGEGVVEVGKTSTVSVSLEYLVGNLEVTVSEPVEDEFNQSRLLQGLVAWYEFEGNADDSSGNGNDGTEYGGVGYTKGVIGKAGSFDGKDDYVNIDAVPDLGEDNYSVSVWINKSQKSIELQSIVTLQKHRYFYMAFRGNNLESRSEPNTINTANNYDYAITTTEEDYTDSQWHNMVAVKTNNTLMLYVDGVYKGEPVNGGISMDRSSYGGSSRVGSYESVSGYDQYYLNGLIDDLRIYNRALSEEEIKALYQMGNSQ